MNAGMAEQDLYHNGLEGIRREICVLALQAQCYVEQLTALLARNWARDALLCAILMESSESVRTIYLDEWERRQRHEIVPAEPTQHLWCRC